MKIKTLKIDKIIPYWRNPRKNDAAVAQVRESIELYGYQMPIVVDKKDVIISGHTRLKALKELEYEEVDVLVAEDLSEAEAKELRIVDNRTSEYAQWDTDQLVLELKEFRDQKLVKQYFPTLNLDAPKLEGLSLGTDQTDLDKAKSKLDHQLDRTQKSETLPITCPFCSEDFNVRVDDLILEARRHHAHNES
jgi:hypothetical protein